MIELQIILRNLDMIRASFSRDKSQLVSSCNVHNDEVRPLVNIRVNEADIAPSIKLLRLQQLVLELDDVSFGWFVG